MIHCIVWAKALYEGLYGSKDQASTNIIEDILEELEQARKGENQVRFAEILFDRMFNGEPANLKKSLKDRLKHAKEKNEEVEDAEETQKFINKIVPLNFADYKDKIELDMQN